MIDSADKLGDDDKLSDILGKKLGRKKSQKMRISNM